jgi:hypothetical protein
MALICMSQGRQHGGGGGGIRRPDQSSSIANEDHHRRQSSKERQSSREASPSTRNRIRPLASLGSDSGTAEEVVGGPEQSAVVDRLFGGNEEGEEEEVKENRDEADMAEAAVAAEAAADQPDDCDSGCECEPEETEGNVCIYFNPNPHCFIAITKATACG